VSSNLIWLDSNSDQFSESATKTLSMRWFIYSHRFIYQWIWFYIHMQIVSLLQWQVESWSLQWASRLVSLLQWHSSSMQWSIYSHRSIYQWIDLPRVSVSNSESATMTSRKLISSMSKSTSESASMTFFVNAMIYLFSSLNLSVNRSILRSHATSEPASMITLFHIVSLLQ